MAPCDHSQRSAVGLRTKRRCAGPSFSAAPAAAPPTRRRWPRLAATQAQKYGPVPGTEAAPTAGPRDQARRQSARAGWGNKRGFFGSTGAWGHPSHPPPTHPTQPNTLTAPRASRRSSGVAWTWPAFQATFPDSRCPGRGGRDWQLGKLPEGSHWGGHGACDERKRRRRGGGGRLRGRLGKEG